MARLADEIIAGAGTDQDITGAMSSMKPALIEAQKFELDDTVREACKHVGKTKPSSILAAVHLARLPYPKLWLEWTPKDDGTDTREGKLPPHRVGVLVERVIKDECYIGTWAWSHKTHGVNVCMLPAVFLLSMRRQQLKEFLTAMPIPDDAKTIFGDSLKVSTSAFMKGHFLHDDGEAVRFMRKNARASWANLPDSEIMALLDLNAVINSDGTSPHMIGFVKRLKALGRSDLIGAMLRSSAEDMEGEAMFLLSFLLMLNSHNSLDGRREDLSRLNRARAKSGKPHALQEFTVTRLRLPSRFNEARGNTEAERSAARAHWVRGHFKLRRTGVFWWCPFTRGDGEYLIRRHYEVAS